MLSGNFHGSEIWHGIFWVLNFGTGIFGGLLEAVGNCLVLIFVPIQSSLSLEIQSIPPPSSPGTTVYLISQNVTFLEKELAIFLSWQNSTWKVPYYHTGSAIITDHYHVD